MSAHRFSGDRCRDCGACRHWPAASRPCPLPHRPALDALASMPEHVRMTLARKVRHRRARGATVPEIARRFALDHATVAALLGRPPATPQLRDHGHRVERAVTELGAVTLTSRVVALAAGVTQHTARHHLERLADLGRVRLVARTAPSRGRYGRVVVHQYEVC